MQDLPFVGALMWDLEAKIYPEIYIVTVLTWNDGGGGGVAFESYIQVEVFVWGRITSIEGALANVGILVTKS